MKKYFENQIEKVVALTEENLSKLKGKGLYGEYKTGDKVLFFLESWTDFSGQSTVSVRSTTEAELDRLDEDYIFVRDSKKENSIPVLKRIEK